MRRAVERAEERLEQDCSITVHTHLSDKLIAQLEGIDHEKFRRELWYTSDDFLEKTKQKDFVCFVLSVSHEPVAFLFGYDYKDEPQGFFLDEVATHIEGKGLGKILITLLFVYCYELGYNSVVLYTEDLDQERRPLREFYEHMGFYIATTDPTLGVIMRHNIEEKSLKALYKRVMYREGGPFPPYLERA